jgi:hypothetical protein
MAEMDLLQLQAFADKLAGDVLNQIERDGSVNRENIAGQLLAGLVLEAAREQMKDRLFTQAGMAPSQIGGLQALVAEYPITGIDIVPHAIAAAIAEKRNEGMHRVVAGVAWNVGDKHVFCECPECKRRRKLSLCGCEMCMHHTEAAVPVYERRGIEKCEAPTPSETISRMQREMGERCPRLRGDYCVYPECDCDRPV